MSIEEFTKNDKKATSDLGFSSKKELGAFVKEHKLNGKTVTKVELLRKVKAKQVQLKKAKEEQIKKSKTTINNYLADDNFGLDEKGEPVMRKRTYGIQQAVKNRGERTTFNCEITVKYEYALYNNGRKGRVDVNTSSFLQQLHFQRKPTDEQIKAKVNELGKAYFNTIKMASADSLGGGADMESWGVRITLLGISFKGVDNTRVYNKFKKITDVPMLKIDTTIYKRLNAEVNNPTEEGMCVQEFLIKHLTSGSNQKLNKATILKAINQVKEKYDLFDADGLTINQTQEILNVFKVSHYALDFTKQVVHKKAFHPSNYEPLMYFILSNHMYPITDKVYRQHILKSEAEKEKGNNTVQLSRSRFAEMEDKNDELADRLKTLPCFELMDEKMTDEELLDKIKDLSDCNVFINRNSLRSFMLHLFKVSNTEYLFKTSADVIKSLEYENNVMLLANPNWNINDATPGDRFTWRQSSELCKQAGMKFINQNIQNISSEIRTTDFNPRGNQDKFIRRSLTKEERKQIWLKQFKKCNNCNQECKFSEVEIDHFTPRWQTADDSDKNYKPCVFLAINLRLR